MGSKRLLVKQLMAKVPKTYGRYFEPFLGSGAMLYALQPPDGYASDELAPVIDLHRAVALQPEAAAASYLALATGCDRRATFMDIRARYPDITPSEFLFLLKNCHGSRFRVNSQGKFNSPFNASPLKSATPSERGLAADAKAMLAAGSYAATVTFVQSDFADAVKLAKSGALVFVDPPYCWQDKGEADYGGQWGSSGWRRLVDTLSRLPPGVNIMITLHGSMPLDEVHALLADIPNMHVEPITLTGCHIRKGGMEARKEWLARNYTS